jgi:hypothetical protein
MIIGRTRPKPDSVTRGDGGEIMAGKNQKGSVLDSKTMRTRAF